MVKRRDDAENGARDPTQMFYYVRALLTTPFDDLRDADLAVSIAEEASAIVADSYRPNDDWLAMAYHDAGDMAAAVATLEPVVAAAPVSSSTDHDNFEKTLVEYYQEMGDTDAAEHTLRDTLDERRAEFAEGTPSIAESLIRLGEFLTNQNRLEEAVPILTEALEIRREQTSTNPWLEGAACSSFGNALLKMNRPHEAEPLLLEGFSSLNEGDYSPSQCETAH